MNLETVTRPMEMFRDQMLRVGAEWAKQGRFMSQSALRSSAHVLAITAERLDVLADRIVPADAAKPAEAVAADATDATVAAPVDASAVDAPAVEATTPEATTPEAPVDAQPAAKADAQPAAQNHHGKKHHRRHGH